MQQRGKPSSSGVVTSERLHQMASDEGGRWDVGTKDNEVFLRRMSESNERLFEDSLEPDQARKLAEVLNKFAGKAEEGTDSDDDERKDADKDDKGRDKDKDDKDRDKDDEDKDRDKDEKDDKDKDKDGDKDKDDEDDES
jgi:hypothetical protein